MNDSDIFGQDIRKYFNYFFETKGFTTDIDPHPLSLQALEAAKLIRGQSLSPTTQEKKAAIIIQGIMPRSGSVYVGELMRLHPDLYAYPYQMWEFPALQLAANVRTLQKKFLLAYKSNISKLEKDDFLPLFGAAMIGYLHAATPPEKRLLIKMPSVQYLSHFFSMFPHENLLILLRDGRDVVHSTLKTWPRLNFLQATLRWNRSAKAILTTKKIFETTQQKGYWIGKFEDALVDPETFVKQACQHFGLKHEAYPFEQIDTVRVIGSSKQHAKGNVDWMTHQERPQDFKPTHYWHNWSAMKRLIFKVVAGRSLIELGYSDDNNW